MPTTRRNPGERERPGGTARTHSLSTEMKNLPAATSAIASRRWFV
jgi:hypothetical protein